MFKGTKIKTFFQHLDEGKSREEAAKLAGIKSTTAQINYRKWKMEQEGKQGEETTIEKTNE